ncbi:glycosyl hydrolase [soil metagenome]
MQPFRLFAATGDAVARIDCDGSDMCNVELSMEGSGAHCVAVDPRDPNRVYVGTFDDGVYRSLDAGESWGQVSEGIPHKRVLSISISPSHQENGKFVVYAGTEPSNLYCSQDDGGTWQEFSRLPELPSAPGWSFPPRPYTSHVRWIAPHYQDPDLIFVGIELGGVMRSTDGGENWEDRKANAYHDSHAVLTHPADSGRVYLAAGGGVSLSTDAGDTWRKVDDGMDRHYAWALAVDPSDPDLWYVSASHGAGYAHRGNGDARGQIYRRRGDEPWQALTLDGSQETPYMPYALVALRGASGTIVAGFQNGEIMYSDDSGDSWHSFGVLTPELLALSEASYS